MYYKENQYLCPSHQNCVLDQRKVLELYL